MKKLNKTGWFFAFILIFISFISCNETNCDDCLTPPEIFRMMVVDIKTGADLIDEETYFSDSLEIFYFLKDEKKKVSFQIKEFNSDESVIESENLPWISAGGDSKTFFVKLNSSDTDTLYVNVTEYLHYCCRSFPYSEVLINGKEMEMNDQGIHLLKK
jgi:hypothetical protein